MASKPTSTYEETNATKSLQSSADPIHWSNSTSYRSSPYRQLHHQNGVIGRFSVRILEGSNLERSHWSVLGMGPVKHLGLSRAHGEVSSFAEFELVFGSIDFQSHGHGAYDDDDAYECDDGYDGRAHDNHCNVKDDYSASASASASGSTSSEVSVTSGTPGSVSHHSSASPSPSEARQTYYYYSPRNSQRCKSTTIHSNSNPIWPTVQSETNRSLFRLELKKGSMPSDGMSIFLKLKMKEESTAADVLLVPGLIKGGAGSNITHCLLGEGKLDLTPLILRSASQEIHTNARNASSSTAATATATGGEYGVGMDELSADGTGVWDVWIELRRPVDKNRPKQSAAATRNIQRNYDKQHHPRQSSAGRVRLLVSYEPVGLSPKRGDIVALESFARRHDWSGTCRPIIPPLHPLTVMDVKGEYVLVEFDIHFDTGESATERVGTNSKTNSRDRQKHWKSSKGKQSHNRNHIPAPTTTSSSSSIIRKGRIKLHRNALFVIERTNLVDKTIDAALKPADVILSTSLGKEVSHFVQPYVEAAGDLIMPVLSSSRLFFKAAKVGGSATLVGLKSATVALVENQNPERRQTVRMRTFTE